MPGIRPRFLCRLRRLRLSVVLLLFTAATAAAAEARIVAAAGAPRIVAVGDVHGDLPAFKAVLVQAGVIDAAGAWAGGSTVLVQTGDLIDRGPSMRSVFDFVMALEQAAVKGGGRVVPLLGNHEVMNITGDLRYVAAASYAEFADTQSEKRREDAWKQVAEWRKRRAARLHLPEPAADPAAREAWMQAHPPGYVEHAEAFGPAGVYGRWLRAHSAVFAEQGTAFLHGGISPSSAGSPLSDINRRVHEDLASYDTDRQRFVADGVILPFSDLQETLQALREELQALPVGDADASADKERRKVYETFLDWGAWTINSPDGPLWFRGYAEWSEVQGDAEVPKLLSAFGLTRIVVAHTPQADGHIHVRFGGKVFLIDTGMNTAFFKSGRGSALEIAGDTVRALYSGEPPQVIWPAPAKAAAAPAHGRIFLGPDGPLPFASDEQVLEFLREARVVEVQVISEGITHVRRLTLERDGVRAHAAFRTVHAEDPVAALSRGKGDAGFRDFYGFEPAAYRLGLLLGIDNIPPATLRRIEGEPGSVQIWIEQAMTEKKRRDEKREPPERLLWQRRLQTRLVWDTLIGNSDRNQGNTLYTPDWQMWLIDHTRAFPAGADLHGAEDIVWCERGIWERLRGIDDGAIRASVVENLKPVEIAGLLERRRRLVDFLDRRIRERGEGAVLFDQPS